MRINCSDIALTLSWTLTAIGKIPLPNFLCEDSKIFGITSNLEVECREGGRAKTGCALTWERENAFCPSFRDGVLYRAVSGQLENLTRLSMIRYCRLNGWGVMKICVPIGGRSCSCGAVRAGGRLATVRWCRLHWSSTTAAQNQTPAALPLCQVSPLRHYYTIITSLLHHYYVIITKGENA